MTEHLGVPLAPGRDSVIVSFNLPYCLYLADGVYSLSLPTGGVEVKLTKVWRERKEEFSNAEIQDDPAGQYRYSRARLGFTVGPDEGAQAITLEAVNRLVDVYRLLTGRAYLRPLLSTDLTDVQIDHPNRREGEVVITFGAGGLGMAYSDDSPEVHAAVRDLLESGEPIPLHEELLLTASRLAVEGYSRQALIDTVSALSVFIELVLSERLVAAGETEEDVERLLGHEPVGDLMKQPMSRAIGWRPSEDQPLWQDWLRINGIRRRAAHRGSTVTAGEAADAVAVVRRLIDEIGSRAG